MRGLALVASFSFYAEIAVRVAHPVGYLYFLRGFASRRLDDEKPKRSFAVQESHAL